MEVLWWPDFLKCISDFLTFQIFFWSSRLFAAWLKTMIFQWFPMKFTKEINSWNSRSNFQNALKKNSDNIFFLDFFYMKGIQKVFEPRPLSWGNRKKKMLLMYPFGCGEPGEPRNVLNRKYSVFLACKWFGSSLKDIRWAPPSQKTEQISTAKKNCSICQILLPGCASSCYYYSLK